MYRFATLLTVVVLLTGTTRAGADPIPQEVFEEEFMNHVMEPCITALLERAGFLHLFNDGSQLSKDEQIPLTEYRFDDEQLTEFIWLIDNRKTYLSNIVRGKPLRLRQAWYAVTVHQCKKKLPD